MKEDELNRTAKKAGIWYALGNILLKGVAFFSLPIFTQLLSTSDFGIYNTYIAYEGILSAIIGLGLYGTVKNAKIEFNNKFNEYLSSVLTLSLFFFLVEIVIANIFYNFYGPIIGFSKVIINCLLLQSYGSFLIYFYASKLNIEFKYKSYLLISALNIICNIGCSIVLIKFVFPSQRYLGRILGSAIPLIFISFIITFIILVKGKKFVSKKYWKFALLIGIPLVPHVISQSLLSQFDRIMINNMVGSSESGIYSYVYTMCTILSVLCQSLDNAWTPWVYMKLSNSNIDEIKKKSQKYIALFSILTLGFMCLIPEVMKLFAREEYWDGINLTIPLSLANYFIFLYMLPVGIEYYNKKTKYISIGTVLATFANVILNYIMIKLLGYKMAAYTTLISYILLFVFHWNISRKFNGDKVYDITVIKKNIIIILSVSILISVTQSFYLLNLIMRYLIVFILIYIIFRNKNELLSIFKRRGNEDFKKNNENVS